VGARSHLDSESTSSTTTSSTSSTTSATTNTAGYSLIGFPSSPALHFNEMGMAFTRLLLLDLETCLQLKTEKDRKEFFALKPINVITWPEIAREYLSVVSQYRHCTSVTSTDTMRWLRNVPSRPINKCLELLAVLCAHPLSTPFLEPVNATEVSGYAKVVTKPMDFSAVRRKIYTYDSHYSYASDIRLIWSNCLAFNDAGTYLARSALTLSEMFETLYKKWILDPEEAEMMMAATANPTTAAAAAAAVTTEEEGLAPVVVTDGGDMSKRSLTPPPPTSGVSTMVVDEAASNRRKLNSDSTYNALVSCLDRREEGMNISQCANNSEHVHPAFASGVPPKRKNHLTKNKSSSSSSSHKKRTSSSSSSSSSSSLSSSTTTDMNVEHWGDDGDFDEDSAGNGGTHSAWIDYNEPYPPLSEGPARYAHQLADVFYILREVS
jgi:hypothetical protein